MYFDIGIIDKKLRWQTVMCLVMTVISFAVALFILLDFAKPRYYAWLFLLPLTFGILSLLYNRLYLEVPMNLGISVILVLFFVRTVVSPLFMCFGNYAGTISLNIDKNTTGAILLVVYESICVFTLLNVLNKKNNGKIHNAVEHKDGHRYAVVLGAVVFALLICIAVAPELLKGYRTIFHMTEKTFTHYEDTYLVECYGTTFAKKLALVTGQYIVRILLIVIPAYLMVLISAQKTFLNRCGALACCILPMFAIGGTIARNLIYTVCLLLLYNYIFNGQKISKKAVFLLGGAGLTVVAWWMLRGGMSSLFEQFSKRFSAYFSGVNVVSGAFNLPDNAEYKVGYFVYDFIGSIPYGTTLFGISHERVQTFFNTYNASSGQIPPTIGMGYYYFGPVLAPVYSILLAYASYKAGFKLKNSLYACPMTCIRLLVETFYLSMGIIMYNIEITISNCLSVLLPIYLMELIAYKVKERSE